MHTPEHWTSLETLENLSKKDLSREGENFDSVYLSKDSFIAAKLAAGSLLAITDEVISDRVIY